MPGKIYIQEDFEAMALKVRAIREFAGLLDGNYDHTASGITPASIAAIIKTLLDPVEDFLFWACIHAEIPVDTEEETIAIGDPDA
jgi:hypothetical protein